MENKSIVFSFCVLYLSLIQIYCSFTHCTYTKLKPATVISSSSSYHFQIDDSFTQHHIALIKKAIRWWRQQGKTITYSFVHVTQEHLHSWYEDGKATIYNAMGKFTMRRIIARSLIPYLEMLGVTQCGSNDIFILEDGGKFYRVVLHELGHVFLGSGHSKDPKDLMYPHI